MVVTRRTRSTAPVQQSLLKGAITKNASSIKCAALRKPSKATKTKQTLPSSTPATNTLVSSPTQSFDTTLTTATSSLSSACPSSAPCNHKDVAPKQLDFDVPAVATATIATPPSLHPSSPTTEEAKPDIPAGREDQFKRIHSLITESLSSSSTSRPVYVCGTPGTGKTLTIKSVLSHLRASHGNSLHQLFFNCASIASSSHLLAQLSDALGLPFDANGFATMLSTFLHDEKRAGRSVLLVIDEIDLLLNAGKHALYSLFDACRACSNVCLLFIANGIDIPTRLLPLLSNSVDSRPVTVAFKPYAHSELLRIARARLSQIADARVNIPGVVLVLASKKVASKGGDARMIIHLLHSLVQHLVTNGYDHKNLLSTMLRLVNAHRGCDVLDALEALPTHQFLALVVIVNGKNAAMSASGKKKRTNMLGLYDSFRRMCERLRIPPIDWAEFTAFVTGSLVQQGIVEVAAALKGGRGRSGGKDSVATVGAKVVGLKVDVEDVRKAAEKRPQILPLLV